MYEAEVQENGQTLSGQTFPEIVLVLRYIYMMRHVAVHRNLQILANGLTPGLTYSESRRHEVCLTTWSK